MKCYMYIANCSVKNATHYFLYFSIAVYRRAMVIITRFLLTGATTCRSPIFLLLTTGRQHLLPLLSIAQKLLTIVLISGNRYGKVDVSKSQYVVNTHKRYRCLLVVSQIFVPRLDHALKRIREVCRESHDLEIIKSAHQ